MAVAEFKLEINKREDQNNSVLKQRRREGKIPGIYYSHASKDSVPFFIEESELHNAQKSDARLYKINVGGGLRTVIFKDIQYHPVTDEVIHVDLYGVRMDETILIKVPLNLIGDPIGALEGEGQLTQPIQELEVICLPSNIPDFVELDVSHLDMNESIHAGEVGLPEDIELSTNEDAVVALVSHGIKLEETISAEGDGEDLMFEEGEGEETTEESDDTQESPPKSEEK